MSEHEHKQGNEPVAPSDSAAEELPDETSSPQPSDDFAPDDSAAEELLEQEASASLWKENRQVLILALCVIAFLAVTHFTPLQAWLKSGQQWKHYIDEFGIAAHLVFGAMCMLAVMFGMPRLPLCSVAGAVFGFKEGLVISWLSSTLGSYGSFLLSRWGGRRVAEQRLQRWPWLRTLLAAPSLLRVILVRQLMVPGVVLNLLFGMTAVRHRTFFFGTLLGYLPLNIALTLVGSGLGKETLAESLKQILAALAVINVIAWIVVKLMKKREAY